MCWWLPHSEAINTFFMRMYQIPPNMREKEKVIGGILNINQFFWILTGLILGALVFAITFGILGGTFAIILGVIFCFTGVPFAVYKKNGLTLFEFLKYRQKFKKKTKKLPNRKKEVEF